MTILVRLTALILVTAAAPAMAAQAQPNAGRPDLVIALSVDQLSSELFNEYRPHLTGGLKRLAEGIVFSNGYQAHGGTETCPGHATILTGSHPSRTGIVANEWYDHNAQREDKEIYCAEDESVPGSNSRQYTVSNVHLKTPALGDYMKQADPGSRVVSVAGKDRSAVMMGGKAADLRLYWNRGTYVPVGNDKAPPVVEQFNASLSKAIATPRAPLTPPAFCAAKDRSVQVGTRSFGTHRFQRAAGDISAFQRSPEWDAATLALAAALVQQMQLGRAGHTDLIAIGASATDYVGHGYGPGGLEMCLQLASLDADLGSFFDLLDKSGINYLVVLTADHGGRDIPERSGIGRRADPSVTARAVGVEVGRRLGIPGEILVGDWYVSADVPADRRGEVVATARQILESKPEIEAVYSATEIAAHPLPTTRPENWTLLDKFRASFDPKRSGDLFVALKEGVTPIQAGGTGSVAGHGTVWDYDRKVPILFWWPGVTPQERDDSAMTVDILPTLAGLIGIKVTQDIDGKPLDLRGGAPID